MAGALIASGARASVPVAERVPPPPAPAPFLRGGVVYGANWDVAGAVRLSGLRLDGDVTFIPGNVLSLVGQPVTPELIRKIEARLGRDLSAGTRPVIALYEPAAGDASGVLTFGVRPFRLGHVTASGKNARDDRFVESRLRLSPGAAVDPDMLAFDVESLNRYPFRQVGVKVAQARDGAQADVAVDVTETKPWSANWGYKYSGGPHESWRRAYAGGSVGDLLGQDSVVSLQATLSPNAIVRSNRHPDFLDGDLTYTVPLDDRGIVEAGYELTGMAFKFPPDIYWLDETDGVLGYRYLLTGPATGWGQSDARAGLDIRHERIIDYRMGPAVFDMTSDLDEVYFGYHINRVRTAQQTDFDISLRLSPAVDLPDNSASHYALYSSGRMKSAHYGYVNFTLDETVGTASGPRWHTQLIGGLASGPLPYFDQVILGGQSDVRGYFLADGSFDDALVWRNEFRWTPAAAWLKNLSPFVLADIGAGHDDQLKDTKTLASAGFGMALPVSGTTNLSFDLARALRHGPGTAAGNVVFETNLKTSY